MGVLVIRALLLGVHIKAPDFGNFRISTLARQSLSKVQSRSAANCLAVAPCSSPCRTCSGLSHMYICTHIARYTCVYIYIHMYVGICVYMCEQIQQINKWKMNRQIFACVYIYMYTYACYFAIMFPSLAIPRARCRRRAKNFGNSLCTPDRRLFPQRTPHPSG